VRRAREAGRDRPAPVERFAAGRHRQALLDEVVGGITKQGNRYLRQLLVVGALAVIRYAERHGTRRPWLVQLMARRTTKIAAVALANKTARMIWAIMISGEAYREPELRVA
jgi:transposase